MTSLHKRVKCFMSTLGTHFLDVVHRTIKRCVCVRAKPCHPQRRSTFRTRFPGKKQVQYVTTRSVVEEKSKIKRPVGTGGACDRNRQHSPAAPATPAESIASSKKPGCVVGRAVFEWDCSVLRPAPADRLNLPIRLLIDPPATASNAGFAAVAINSSPTIAVTS
jgi:hypothetical protein